MTGELCDSFGLDIHTIFKADGQSEVFIPLSTPRERLSTIEDFVEDIARHLRKTQIKADRRGQNDYFSKMVSLNGDLL
jgi:hypothetical protein